MARNRPGVIRVVLELRTEVSPQVFSLAPVGEYGHRLVVDLYPTTPLDPLMALLEAEARRDASEGAGSPSDAGDDRTDPPANGAGRDTGARKPERRRPITVAIDPGHGGEDPGAIGPAGTYEKHVALAIGRRRLVGCRRSFSTSARSLKT